MVTLLTASLGKLGLQGSLAVGLTDVGLAEFP